MTRIEKATVRYLTKNHRLLVDLTDLIDSFDKDLWEGIHSDNMCHLVQHLLKKIENQLLTQELTESSVNKLSI